MFTINEYVSSNENGRPQVEVTEKIQWPPRTNTFYAEQLPSGTWIKKANHQRLSINAEVERFQEEIRIRKFSRANK